MEQRFHALFDAAVSAVPFSACVDRHAQYFHGLHQTHLAAPDPLRGGDIGVGGLRRLGGANFVGPLAMGITTRQFDAVVVGAGGNSGTGATYGVGGGGGSGAVRIIWPGTTRQFPSTNTADV